MKFHLTQTNLMLQVKEVAVTTKINMEIKHM